MKKISMLKAIILIFLIPFCLYLLFKIHSYWSERISHEDSSPQEEESEIARVEKFEMKGLELDGDTFTLKADKFSQLEEGLSLLEQIDPLVIHTSQGKKIFLTGKKGLMIEKKNEASKIVIEGEVTIRTEEGHEIQSEKLIYENSSREVFSPGEVTLSGSGFKGKASQLHYSLQSEVIELAPHFELTLARESNDIHIQSASFKGSLDLKEGLLSGGVSIKDDQKEILAGEAKLMGDRVTDQWREVQLSGGVNGNGNLEGKSKKTLLSFLAQEANLLFNKQGKMEKIILKKAVSVILREEGDNPN